MSGLIKLLFYFFALIALVALMKTPLLALGACVVIALVGRALTGSPQSKIRDKHEHYHIHVKRPRRRKKYDDDDYDD